MSWQSGMLLAFCLLGGYLFNVIEPWHWSQIPIHSFCVFMIGYHIGQHDLHKQLKEALGK